MKRKLFTIIELLIVVAVIAILVSILLPSLKNARYKAKLAVCQSNLSQIVRANLQYATNNNGLYPHREAAQSTHFGTPYTIAYPSKGEDDRHYLRQFSVFVLYFGSRGLQMKYPID